MTKSDSEYLERLKVAMEEITGYNYADIIAKNRKREMTTVRFIVCYLLKKNTIMTFESIGEELQRDHSTIINAVNSVSDWYLTPPMYRSNLNLIKQIEDAI
jgi:chromosomal replication initiation ATPase DnaA